MIVYQFHKFYFFIFDASRNRLCANDSWKLTNSLAKRTDKRTLAALQLEEAT